MKSRMITLAQLVEHRACESKRDLFKELFGDKVEITVELCIAVADKFDFSWAANNLLSASARKLYDETCAPAWKLYDETCAPAWKLYEETRAPAWKLYEETCAQALKLYNKETRAQALKPYEEACATAWANAYLGE